MGKPHPTVEKTLREVGLSQVGLRRSAWAICAFAPRMSRMHTRGGRGERSEAVKREQNSPPPQVRFFTPPRKPDRHRQLLGRCVSARARALTCAACRGRGTCTNIHTRSRAIMCCTVRMHLPVFSLLCSSNSCHIPVARASPAHLFVLKTVLHIYRGPS